MEVSYNELRQKEVINIRTGKRLGRISDMIISSNDKCVLGLVVPAERKLFAAREDIFIPWQNIKKIGDDVILIILDEKNCPNIVRSKNKDDEHCSFGESGDFLED